jgi:hypothetical protein
VGGAAGGAAEGGLLSTEQGAMSGWVHRAWARVRVTGEGVHHARRLLGIDPSLSEAV